MSSFTLGKLRAPERLRLLAGTALCGALAGLALAPGLAHAQSTTPPVVSPPPHRPEGGLAQVSAGGGLPSIVEDGAQTIVDLNAPRTVINWTTYNVGPDHTVSYRFDARDWIVLNRVTGLQLSKIEGTVEGRVGDSFGGNIWFASNSGIIFGRGARVDAGGLLVAIGQTDTQRFLDPSNNLFSFSGGDVLPDSRIWALSGASLTAHGGPVAFVGPGIVTRANATVTALNGGSVLYGAADSYQIRLAPGTGGDFDLVDFIVPGASGGTDDAVPMDLAGATRGDSVFVAAVAKGALTGAVINLEGLITAQSARADGGDIILSGGGGIANRQPSAPVDGAGTTDIYLNQAVASRDLTVNNAGRVFGTPWPRPPERAKDPLSLEEQQQFDEECALDPVCSGEYEYYCYVECYTNGGVAPLIPRDEDFGVISDLFDPSIIQNISVGRDARIRATQTIELGRLAASGDVEVEGLAVRGNGLVASGALDVRATAGDVALAGVNAQGQSTISATGDVLVDAMSAAQRLTITAGRDIGLGDGSSSVAGLISLEAARDVNLNLDSARIDSVVAGNAANLRGGALEIGAVTAPRLLAHAASVNIGTATSAGDIYVVATSGDAVVGTANSGDDVFVLANNGAASLGQATLGDGPDIVGAAFAGNPDAAGNGRVVLVESANGDARLGLGDGAFTGATSVTVRAGRDAAVDVAQALPGAFQVVGGRDVALRSPAVSLESITAGRDISLSTTSGDFISTEALVATRSISITASGAVRVADVRADSGSVALTGASVTAGAVSASEDVTLRALSGGVQTASFQAGRDLILEGASLSLGSPISSVARDLSITTTGAFTASGALSAGRNLTLNVGGKATLGAASANSGIRILAGDLDLTGVVSAPTVQIESLGGALRVGGASGDLAGSMVVDNTEFGRLRASGELRLYAGSTTGSSRGDLVVQDLTVTPANTPRVTLLAGSQRNALVQGSAAPTANGGVFRIGDATDLSWRPNSILVTGSLGAATFSGGGYTGVRAFDEVRLAASQDILMGSQRFITLIQQTPVGGIDISSGLPAGSAAIGGEQFRVFVSAGRLEVSAENKVVQQNTSPSIGQAVGVFLTGGGPGPSLIIDPPRVVDLFGALAGPDGRVTTGQNAGRDVSFEVVDQLGQPTQPPEGATYRFNSCTVGTGQCAALAPTAPNSEMASLTARDGLGLSSMTGEEAAEQQAAEVSSETLANPPVLLGVAPADGDDIVTDPVVTGAGSEEIWRERRRGEND